MTEVTASDALPPLPAGDRIVALGEAALTLVLGDRIAPATHHRVMAARAALPALDSVDDIVPSYCTLTVHFDPARLDPARLRAALHAAAWASLGNAPVAAGRLWEIPVQFGGEHGPDLEPVAQALGRSADDVVQALCGLELQVYLIGFLPGFPYLGELPTWMRLPRRATPRTAVPARSVAIAGAQAAVYPWQSPGGWHLLGRTPLALFDADHPERPALLAPGDRVRFVAT